MPKSIADLLTSLLCPPYSPPRDPARDTRTLWTISGAVAVLVFALAPVTYFPVSDSYLRFARGMVSSSFESGYFRTAGYPLLMLATGVLHFETFFWLVLAQVAMAVSIPILVYRIASTYDRQVAYYTALVSIVTLVPYGYAKSVFPEQLYMFLILLLVDVVNRAVNGRRPVYLYAAALTLFALAMTKPVATYLFVVSFAALLVIASRIDRAFAMHVVAAAIVAVLLTAGTPLVRHAVAGRGAPAVTAVNPVLSTGRLLFYNVYLTGGHLNNDVMRLGRPLTDAPPFLAGSSGPEVQRLAAVLRSTLTREYVAQTTEPLRRDPVQAFFYEKHLENPTGLADAMLSAPSLSYFWYMWTVLDHALGPEGADDLFLRVSLEILREKPSLAVKYLSRNLYFFASGVSIDYIYALHPNYNLKVTQSNLGGLVAYTPVAPNDVLSAGLSLELNSAPGRWNTIVRAVLFYDIWTSAYLIWRPIVFALMAAGPLLLLGTAYRPIALFGVTVVLYHMLIVCGFQMPIDRYVTETILVELVIAVPAGIQGLRNALRFAWSLRESSGLARVS